MSRGGKNLPGRGTCYERKEMILLTTKHEEEKKLLEKRLEADIEAQKDQMMNTMKANIQAARNENEAVVDQKNALKNSIAEMQRSLDELNRRQIEGLKNAFKA